MEQLEQQRLAFSQVCGWPVESETESLITNDRMKHLNAAETRKYDVWFGEELHPANAKASILVLREVLRFGNGSWGAAPMVRVATSYSKYPNV
mgnify:CR=1 FL=1